MVRIPLKDQEFWRNNKQVFSKEYPDGRWMALKALRKVVIAGNADDWWVLDVDFATGENLSMCPYCATDVEHPPLPLSAAAWQRPRAAASTSSKMMGVMGDDGPVSSDARYDRDGRRCASCSGCQHTNSNVVFHEYK